MGRSVLDKYEIIVVNDASTDGSGELAESLKSEFSELVVCHHQRNQGLGAAIRTGFRNATLDWVLYVDSDLPVDILELKQLFPTLELSHSDLLIGYRLGRAEGARRAIISWIYNRMIRILFGLKVRDVNFAFKMIPREILNKMDIRSEGSFVDAEMLLEAVRQGAAVKQRGFVYHQRVAGVSTIGGMKVVPQILRDLTDYRLHRWLRGVPERRVIFNADDFGLNKFTTAGVCKAVENGVVRSVSIMPTGDEFRQACDYCLRNKDLDVGVHLALCEVAPASNPANIPSLLADGKRFASSHKGFVARYLSGGISEDELEQELRAQVAAVAAEGIKISHLNSHQHVHALPGVMKIIERIALDYSIPAVRWPSDKQLWPSQAGGVNGLRRSAEAATLRAVLAAARMTRLGKLWSPDHFLGMTNAGRWSSQLICDSLRGLEKGVTEIACHPVEGGPASWQTADELHALTSPEVARALLSEGIEITTYSAAARK